MHTTMTVFWHVAFWVGMIIGLIDQVVGSTGLDAARKTKKVFGS